MLKPRSPQASFYGSYLYDKIVPVDHLLRKINQVVDFSFIRELVQDRYSADFGRPAENPEFMLPLCLLQYPYGDSDREVVANARLNLAYKYFLGLAVDEEVLDDSTISCFRAIRLGEAKFRQIFGRGWYSSIRRRDWPAGADLSELYSGPPAAPRFTGLTSAAHSLRQTRYNLFGHLVLPFLIYSGCLSIFSHYNYDSRFLKARYWRDIRISLNQNFFSSLYNKTFELSLE
jgi:transposase